MLKSGFAFMLLVSKEWRDAVPNFCCYSHSDVPTSDLAQVHMHVLTCVPSIYAMYLNICRL